MRFYERLLGGKIEAMMTHAESPAPAQSPPGMSDRIMHARLNVGGRILMASDSMVGKPIGGSKGFSLSLSYATTGEAKKIFDALAEGGRVTMPMQESFWAKAFGMLVDRYGTAWMVNGEPAPM